MVRMIYEMWPSGGAKTSAGRLPLSMWLPWTALIAAVIFYPLAIPAPPGGLAGALLSTSALWPPVAGILLALGAVFLYRRMRVARRLWRWWSKIPEGDLLIPVEAAGGRASVFAGRVGDRAGRGLEGFYGGLIGGYWNVGARLQRRGALLEDRLRDWTTGGIALVCLVVILALAAAIS